MACARCGSQERYSRGRCAPCTRAANQRWKADNRERHRAGSRRWAEANPDACRSAGRKWGRENAATRAEYKRAWREANPEKHAAHEQARRARKNACGGSYTSAEWLELCEGYGGRCLRCGLAGLLLTVDHVTPLSLGGANDIANIQPLCGPCNSAKGTSCTDYRTGAQLLEHLTEEAAA